MPTPLAGPERFAALAAAIADPVRRYLWRRTDEAQADGVLASTLGVLHRRWDDLPDGDPVPWAIGVARLQLQTARRLQRRQVLLSQRVGVVDPPQLHDEEASDIAARLALARVREADAELLRLWAWEGLGIRGIAVVQAESAESVAMRLDRGRTEFAGLLAAGSRTESSEHPRSVLHTIDPAATLPPLTPAELAAHITAATGGPGTQEPPTSVPRRGSPWLTVGVGALSTAAAASLLLPFALGIGGTSSTSFQLSSTGGPSAVCSPVTAEALSPAQVAFRAEVRGIDGAVVTLHVLDRYAGEIGDTVTLTQATETAVDGAPITFDYGVDYLLAADGDTILTCGLSGPSSPELTALYREAFALR
ncbi:RNA polymerase sigma factor [Rathayibacter rathayi]|uniref:RNA polymerase sigma factor n=1 Tax=Rathayibacter rathayi TaxID=33887 RepID=UPI000CE8DB4E|nr:sigma-70 family RNA polymerase sigma factor [Rathayibacter rathayi]PPG67394.1 hypothetical protein C5C02_09575 [Rathayibacter rathayi]PPG75898.1 hypothetical protein C5C23_09315 [Rathayibacter rathayi]PPI76125.1 hypothetical protein C5E03_11245 [Rathayibacter rathayi]